MDAFNTSTQSSYRRACSHPPGAASAASRRGRGQAVPAHLSARARRTAAARVRAPPPQRWRGVVRADRQRTEPGEPNGGSAAGGRDGSRDPVALRDGRLSGSGTAAAGTDHVPGRSAPSIRRHHPGQPAERGALHGERAGPAAGRSDVGGRHCAAGTLTLGAAVRRVAQPRRGRWVGRQVSAGAGVGNHGNRHAGRGSRAGSAHREDRAADGGPAHGQPYRPAGACYER